MSLSYQHILSLSGRWVLTGPQKSEQLRSPDLDQQSGTLPAVLLVRSQPPAYVEFLRAGGTAKAAGWSPLARAIERHGALSRHIPCAVTSSISCSDLHLPFLQQLLWKCFSSLGGWGSGGDGGEMLKPSSWPSDSWGRVHWGNCSYNLTGWWPVFHQSFLSSHSQRWDTSYIQKDGQKATALQLTFSGKYYLYHKIIDFHF